ncbi:MAG TPA: PQQ-binding-like beta-propeller repeat protein [Vicinamibacterales bacterium]|nr:PQQ-binding-like beta-propeller repeat protein [Vicinamibacterales bacterium]
MAVPVLVLIVLIGTATQADWRRFRGPNGSGVGTASSLPAEFGPATNLYWKAEVPFGRSSPVIAGNRIFLTASEGDKLITMCFDRSSGKLLWRREATRARQMSIYKGNDPASPTPVSDGTNVYVFFAELGLISYGPDGRERWRLPLGPFNTFYGIGASPVFESGTLVMVCDQRTDSHVLAVDARDGTVRWKSDRSSTVEGYATPVIYSPAVGEPQVLVLGSHTLEAYALNTGRRLWWVGQLGYAPKGVPVIGRDMVYVSAPGGDEPAYPPFDEGLKQYDANGDRRIQYEELRSEPGIQEHFGWMDSNGDGAIDRAEYDPIRNASAVGHGLAAIRLGGTGNLTATNIAWRVKKAYPNVPAPLLYDGVLYVVRTGGIITSLHPQSGEVLKTGRSESAIEEYFSSPVAADGKVFLVSESGKVTVLKSGEQWEIVAVNDLAEEVWATPAIAEDAIYIRTRSALYAFRADQAGRLAGSH